MKRKNITVWIGALALCTAAGGAVVAQNAATVNDGIYTIAQADRGHNSFNQNCAACHGANMAGTGEAPGLVGGEFLSNWTGLSVGQLFDRIRTTMPQDTPGKLGRETYAEILAYILKENDYPVGQKDLDTRSEFLKAIKMDAPPEKNARVMPAIRLTPVVMQMGPAASPAAAPAAAPRPERYPPADLAALAAGEKASGILSASANDPRNAPGTQPNSYAMDEHFFKLPEGRSFGSTSSVGVDSKGHIWVAERCGANNCAGSPLNPVVEFDAKGNYITSFGAGMFLFPHDLFIDKNDHLWIADGHVDAAAKKGNVVMEFDTSGKLLMTLGTPGATGVDAKTFDQPNAVLVTPTGTIFVSDGHDAGPAHPARVSKFDAKGKFIKSWGARGLGADQMEVPHALAMDSKGDLYVGDRWNNRVVKTDQDGKLLEIFTQFGRPSGIFIDKNDILYSTDSESRSPVGYGYNPGWKRGIHVGSVRDGIVTAFIPDTDPNPDASATSGGEGIWVDPNGVIYSGQVGQKNVVRYVKR